MLLISLLEQKENREISAHDIIKITFIIGTVTAVISLFLFLSKLQRNEDPLLIRLDGVFGYANTQAIFLGVCIILGLYLIRSKSPGLKTEFLYAGIIINVLAVFLSYSRMTWIYLSLSVLIYILLQKNRGFHLSKVTAIIGFSLCAGIIVSFKFGLKSFAERITSINITSTELLERFAYIKDGIQIFRENLLFGIGPGAWNSMQYQYQTAIYSVKYIHSWPVQVLVDNGITGIALFMVPIFLTLRYAISALKKPSKTEQKNTVFTLVIVNFLLLFHSLLDIDFEYPAIVIFYWLTIVALYSLSEKRDNYILTLSKKIKALTLIACFIISIPPISIGISASVLADGIKNLERNKLSEALENFRYAVRTFPYSSDTYYFLGQTYIQIYTNAESQKENSVKFHENIISGIENLQKAQALDHFNPKISTALIRALKYDGQSERAIQEYQNLIVQQPLLLDHYENFAKILVQSANQDISMGNQESAKVKLSLVMSLPQKLDAAKKKISPIAFRLKHKPMLDPSKDFIESLDNAYALLNKMQNKKSKEVKP